MKDNNFDKKISLFGIIVSFVLIIYLSVKSKSLIYITSVHIIAVVMILFSCLIWLYIRKNAELKIKDQYQSNYFIILNIFSFLFLMLTILSIYFRPNIYMRPIEYFISISIMTGIVSLEIFYAYSNRHNFLILLQIFIIGLIVIFSQMSIFPNVVGTDPWWHQMFASIITSSGNIPEGYMYSDLPLFHLEIATTSILTGLDYKYSSMFSIGVLQILTDVLFLFILGRYFLNEKVGLLSGLLLVTANQYINKGFEIVPNGFGVAVLIVILYLLYKMRFDKPFVCTALIILMMLTIILINTIASMGMSIILFASWIFFRIYDKIYDEYSKKPISIGIPIIFFIGMITYWAYVSNHLTTLAELIKSGFSINARSLIINVPSDEKLFDNLGMFLFFMLAFIGYLYMISNRYGNPNTFVMANIGLTILSLGFYPYIAGYSIIEARWWYLAQILLSIPSAIALFLISNIIKKRCLRDISITGLITFITFIMIMSPIANIDNPIFSPNSGERLALKESEIYGAKFFVKNFAGNIYSDYFYAVSYSSSIFKNYYNVSNDNIKSLDRSFQTKEFEHDDSIKIIRTEIIDKPFRLYNKLYKFDYDPNIILGNEFNKIYDNSMVIAYS